jgi:hypothetical protein
MTDIFARLWVVRWNGVPIAYAVVVSIGGPMYAVMSLSTRSSASSTTAITVRRPGWLARRRARGGIAHKRDRIGVGYTSATSTVYLTGRELAHHGAVFGGPGSGKTTFLQLLVEANVGRVPVVIVDPKGSPALGNTVRSAGGQVWTLDGRLSADLLDPRPWQVPDLLLEAEDYAADARAYRDAAHQRALWAAWALALRGEPMDLAQLRRLLDRTELLRALEPFRNRDPRIADWLDRLEHQRGGIEDSGARGLDRSLGVLLDGVAMRGSLRTCPEALRVDDVVDTNGLVLFSLDVADYPHATRKVASWILLGMSRLARQLGDTAGAGPRALLLVDEVGALGHSARHLRGLVGRARESGLAVVLATQGPSDLEAVDRVLLPQVLQDTAWQLVFRQGSPHDARQVEALFGQGWISDVTNWSDGRLSSRLVERPRVSIDEWMNSLEPGDAWLRVAPIDRGWRQARVRVALPRPSDRKQGSETRSGNTIGNHVRGGGWSVSDRSVSDPSAPPSNMVEAQGELQRAARALPAVPPDCPPDLVEKMGAEVLAKVERRWPTRHHELGPCLVWREREPTIQSAGNIYGRLYDPTLKRSDAAHRVVWRRVYGAIPKGPDSKPLEVDHLCEVTLCQRPDHLTLRTKRDNVQRRGPTRGPNKRVKDPTAEIQPKTGNSTTAVAEFAITLFERIDRPLVSARTASLRELVTLLTSFETLRDKRFGHCWSPTKYTDGSKSRGNAGVEAVSALVFDCDRIPPDEKRLESLYWIGHTTWSHTPKAPRWRVVIPLTKPVGAAEWPDVWRRARAALCPEADPACKDASRAYWLPSHNGGVTAKARRHEGPLLDIATLPELPPDLVRSSTVGRSAPTVSDDRRRAEAYMAQVLENLAKVAPGGRNATLNHAAWTLGRWIAAGALDQSNVEDGLYSAAQRNGVIADDGERQTWATIRSGLSAGLHEPVDLDDANERWRAGARPQSG